jgi:hypothetical protein
VSLSCLLGVLAALLVACSGSGKGLIPTGDAGPLQSDFEAVAHAAESGDGDCANTEKALLQTDQDFAALPRIDAGLHRTLSQGIENLRARSLALCAQPLAQSTEATSTPTTTTSTPTTTPKETQTTTTTSTPTSSTPSPSGPGGGTPAPGEGAPGAGDEEPPGGEGGSGRSGGSGGSGGAKVQGPQEGIR